MADEGEGNLTEERNQIKQLQSDIARKREQLERLKQRKIAFDEELKQRSQQLFGIKEDHKSTQKKAQKTSQYGSAQKTAEAESHYMSQQVHHFLEDRIPAMAPSQEEPDGVDQGSADFRETAGEDQSKQNLHDTVLVSYVNLSGDKKDDDYKVTYRIDGTITVADLLKDACSYWGCSRHDYTLCKIDNDEPKDLSGNMEDHLQDENILSPQEHSHLHLVRKADMEIFKDRPRQQKDRKSEVQEDLNEEGKKLMTLKLGLGNVSAEHVTEPFVEALKAWPGVYKLLKKRNRKHDMQKWLRTRLADFMVFGVLIIFSMACFFLRSETENYLLRFGVENALVVGIPNETSTGVFLEMKDVFTVGDAETYLQGSFDYQLFNPQSTLRKFYTPVGDLRFRVQKAALRQCARPEIPANLARRCQHVEVSNTMDTQELLFDDDNLPALHQLLQNVSGDPTKFSRSTVATDEIWGKNGALYSGAGYSFWFPVNPSTLANLTTKMGELEWLWPQWLTSDTRMLAVEFTLANYHAGGYVSTTLVLEMFPSGASRMTAVLLPFHLAKTSGDVTAEVLDIFRWIIVIGYLCLYKVWRTCEDYVFFDGYSGLRYVLSPAGILDAASIGVFFALQYWRLSKVKPVEPMSSSNSQHYVSYSRWASWEEMAAIGEALFVFLLIIRYTMLLRFYPPVYRFFVLFGKSFRVGLYYLAIFLPVAASTIFFANCLYGPYIEAYSTWVKSLMSFVSVLQNVVDIDSLYTASPAWTLIYVTYCYLILFCFFVNGFLAITAYAYFEVELTEHSDPKYERWTRDQWLDWALPGPIYSRVTGKEPGSSRKIGLVDDEDDGDSSEDEEEDE